MPHRPTGYPIILPQRFFLWISMLKDCLGCQQRRLEDEPIEDRVRILCPACRISRYWNLYKHNGINENRILLRKFSLITKLYCLKQVDSSHTDLKFIKSILLTDKQLTRFNGKLSVANYLGEIDKISQGSKDSESSISPEKTQNTRLPKSPPKKKDFHQHKVHKTKNQCSYCKRYRLLDEPLECSQYRQCPRCIMKRRIKANVSVPLAEPVKLYALKQIKEMLPQDQELIQQVYEYDPFLRQFNNKTFNFEAELTKYRLGLRLVKEESNEPDSNQRMLSTKDLDFHHHYNPQLRVRVSDIMLVSPDSLDDEPPTFTVKLVYNPIKIEPTYETITSHSNKECSRCHGVKRDEPEVLRGYKRCAKCTFNARLKVGTGNDVSKVIKICALQQVLQASHYHTQSLKQKFLNDPFLSQFKKQPFNYKKELAKVLDV